MSEDTFEIIISSGVVICCLAAVAAVGFYLSRSHRDLGTDADLATYRTLHTAALASRHLRNGLTRTGARKAARHLREMLHSDVVVITNLNEVLAADGPPADYLSTALKAMGAGQTRIFRTKIPKRNGTDDAPPHQLVFAPIRTGKGIVGSVGAGGSTVSAGLIRACNELAGWMASQIDLAELDTSRALLMEAQMRALRAQISPHFIYNSLNAIASFINTDPPRARELVLEFADFTRYSFRNHGDFTTIAEELKSVDSYLLLERARFGDRLNVTLHIGPEVLTTVIPFLSLQPLVENAVQHGIEVREGPGHITITAQDAGAYAEVIIEDDGVGMDPDHAHEMLAGRNSGGHVGLRNVDLRLRRFYGSENGLIIETAPGEGTLIVMRVPKFQPENRP
ncbi:sensor histidine kinase [Arthrobacter roseus]|uniref:sensor histidine kinase n=1 Tax=Arthrobacter roseus TaxID=136274 RepID=UPI001962B810|nr:histidine kinase [Arthrobacter roseus]MBM7848183.1 two-component system LytT family sensor kinase [Arthrobacter roseus]